MTLIFQNMATANNALTSGGKTDSGKTATESDTAGVTFGQTLVHQMSSAETPASGKDTSALMLNGSVQMVKDLAALSEGEKAISGEMVNSASGFKQEGLNLEQVLKLLLKLLDQLEEAVVNDSSLLEKLQAWLMQAMGVLNGLQEQMQAQGQSLNQQQLPEGNAQMLSPLASHPETIRFALQDALTQLSQMVKSLPSNEQAQSQVLQLVQSFQALLPESSKGAMRSALAGQTSTLAAMTQANGEQAATVNHRELPFQLKQASASDTPKVSENIVKVNTQVKDGTLGEESGASKSAFLMEADGNTVTAGQLALRFGTAAPVKPMAQPVPVEQFAKEMTHLFVNKLEFVKSQGFSEARILLHPEHLGQVDIRITMQNGQLIAQFMTRNSDARELLDQQMAQLRTALQGQGLQVEKLEVTQSSQPSSSQLHQDGRQSGSGQQDDPNRRSREKEAPSDDGVAAAAITEEWNEWLAEREDADEQGYGETFTAKI
ncbi:flagellar hook-length control protein FliK [Paenibacillus faecalis]|uniref:flagellar hook-length control protein FliK n=1 Tax=Paenibacillus faecalis TaxID=2079532 RepID=UPI000D1047CA|nr:flagellar hook-length control protein FliK [Paenibacillus faecalis]